MASSSAGAEGVGGEQGLRVRCLLVHRDAHVVDGVDDVFDLLGIDDLGGQVIVHLRVGEVALFLAARDQQLQLRLAILRHDRERAPTPRGFLLSAAADLRRAALAPAAAAGARRSAPFFGRSRGFARSLSRLAGTFFEAGAALTGLRSGDRALFAG